MYRRISIGACVLFLVLAGCTPPGLNQNNQTKKLVQKSDSGNGQKEQKVQITPKVESTTQYRTVANFQPGVARGHILYGVDNRLDIDELETGLMRLSQSTFSPDKYIYQDGQYLKQGTIEKWLENKDMNTHTVKKNNGKTVKVPNNKDGLNPQLPKGYQGFSWQKKVDFLESNPSYLSYVVEQNYLIQSGKDKVKLGGVSLAISMAAVYSTQVKDDQGRLHPVRQPLDGATAKKKAKQYAEIILKRFRKNNPDLKVPIVIGLYQEETADSLVPGSYFAKTVVKPGDHTIGDWKAVHESHVLFPSSSATSNHKTDADRFDKFSNQVLNYFPNSIGVIGKGFYKNDQLQHFTIDIPIKFFAETEVISFTQYVTGLVSGGLISKSVPLDVYISSPEGPEALIVKKPGQDQPSVHIFR